MSETFSLEEVTDIIGAKAALIPRLLNFNLTLQKIGLTYRHSYFVSGGCFASWLQGGVPKDIDIWFFNELDAKRVIELYTNDPSYTNEVAVCDEKYRDVTSKTGMMITENAVTLKNGIQLITKHYGTPEEVRKTFDFVHCMPYFDSRDDKMYISREQYDCCVKKRLVANNTQAFTQWRYDKFKNRGYDYVNTNTNNFTGPQIT